MHAFAYQEEALSIELSFKNSIYLTLITFLTVGYGDYYPVTHQGRIINIITAIGGLLYSATIIGIFHELISLNKVEQSVFNFLNSHKMERKHQDLAANMITKLFKI